MKGEEFSSTDLVVIDANDGDLEVCDDEDDLMERVWRLSKPPVDLRLNELTISARRIYRQNRLIASPEACIHQSADSTKRDKGKGVKDPCGCCDACPSGGGYKKKSRSSIVVDKTLYELDNLSN